MKLEIALASQVGFYFGLAVAGLATLHFGPSRLIFFLSFAVFVGRKPDQEPPLEKTFARVAPVLLGLALIFLFMEVAPALKLSAIDHVLDAVALVTILVILNTSIKIGNLAVGEKSQLQQPTP